MDETLIDLIKRYYDERNLKWPDFDAAMKFVMTEIAEVYELDLTREGGWVRNNPQNKPIVFSKEELSRELGDAIMMLLVAGIVEGVNPLESLRNKIETKLAKVREQISFLEFMKDDPHGVVRWD